jgi:nitrogen fixation/metabolism regulation signal transduction histidine kinase
LLTLVERDRDPLANEIFEGRIRAIEIRLRQMLKVKGILGISIFDNSGNLLVSKGMYKGGKRLKIKDKNSVDNKAQIHTEYLKGQHVINYLQKLQVIGENIGFIRIYYSLSGITHEQRMSFLIILGLLGFILIAMLLMLNMILSRVIVQPITVLRDTMQYVQSTGPGLQVQIKKQDEIGDLADAFNRMSEALRVSYQQIESQEAALRRNKNYLDNIINSMPSMLVVVDPSGRITNWNREAEKVTGNTDQETSNQMIYDV